MHKYEHAAIDQISCLCNLESINKHNLPKKRKILVGSKIYLEEISEGKNLSLYLYY